MCRLPQERSIGARIPAGKMLGLPRRAAGSVQMQTSCVPSELRCPKGYSRRGNADSAAMSNNLNEIGQCFAAETLSFRYSSMAAILKFAGRMT